MDYTFAPVDHGGEESGGTVMASLIWLLIPVMAVCIAGLWSSWATRRRANGSRDAAGVAGYDAFRSAMERSRGERAFAVTDEQTAERADEADGVRQTSSTASASTSSPESSASESSGAGPFGGEEDSPAEQPGHATAGGAQPRPSVRPVSDRSAAPMAAVSAADIPSRAAD